MRAAVNTSYGSPEVVRIRDVPKPQPKANEVLVRVHASTVNRTDCGTLRAHPFFIRGFTGLVRPTHTIRGMDFAGTIESVGAGVTSFRPGDRVFGLAPNDSGGHAEYLAVPEQDAMATIPEGVPFDEAVVCEGAWYADSNLRQFGLKPGQTVLIYGASGAIGTAAVQLAKSYGAEVTAVVATRHLELARSLGADRVIDYTAEDFTAIGETFDFVFDSVGKTTYFRCRKLLKPEGTFAATDLGPGGQNIWLTWWSAIRHNNRVIFAMPQPRKPFVDFLRARMAAGEFRAVVDRHYPLDAVAEAYRYVLTGQKTGIVVIDVVAEGESA
jgi:NADPH:quinone reductase-like Zn-dependent oxidoreductase